MVESTTIAQEARQMYRREEKHRTLVLQEHRSAGKAINKAVKLAAGRDYDHFFNIKRLIAPYEDELALDIDWQERGAVAMFDGDATRFYVQVVDEGDGERAETAEVEVYAIAECPRCNRRTPLAPPVSDVTSLGRALESTTPVEQHRCWAI